jgi:hypothetical protein
MKRDLIGNQYRSRGKSGYEHKLDYFEYTMVVMTEHLPLYILDTSLNLGLESYAGVFGG